MITKSIQRNRRYYYYETHLKGSDYESLDIIRLRDPIFFKKYIKSKNDLKIQGDLVERLTFNARCEEVDREFGVEMDEEEEEEEEEFEDEEIEEEIEFTIEDIHKLLKERFIDGQDPTFPYDTVDFNQDYDQSITFEQDLEDAYFEEESDIEINQETNTKAHKEILDEDSVDYMTMEF